jgi:hypothetical protein
MVGGGDHAEVDRIVDSNTTHNPPIILPSGGRPRTLKESNKP